MSNIYIQEPPTNGKVLLVTSVGDIDIELWSKEAPKACRNFVQLCMEGYYDNTLFHRVVKDFIVQGGDPTGSGHGGDSVYDRPFKDEFHQRLRFVRRGLVAMANAGPNDNSSQFFFTMAQTPELQNKHTIFGKVTGNTVYNMLKLQECEVNSEERPLYPNKIIKTQILSNPYDDIIPRVSKRAKKEEETKPKSKSKATKNFKLLSFGEEAEEDEEQDKIVSSGWKGKSKSSHDLSNDPKLSNKPAVAVSSGKQQKHPRDSDIENSEDEQQNDEMRENVKKKLKKEPEVKETKIVEKKKSVSPSPKDNPEKKALSKSEELKREAKQLKKEIRDSKKRSEQRKAGTEPEKEDTEQVVTVTTAEAAAVPLSNDPLADFKKEQLKYKTLRKQQGKKGGNREEITLSLLEKFKTKLSSAQTIAGEYGSDDDAGNEPDGGGADTDDMSWMHHTLRFEEQKRKVLDANIHDIDRYEIHDPRNPLTKRRREESKQKMKGKR